MIILNQFLNLHIRSNDMRKEQTDAEISFTTANGDILLLQAKFLDPNDRNVKALLAAAREGLILEVVAVGSQEVSFKISWP